MASIKSPKIFDPYLGEMYGNILDQYDNPTYNIKLYMKSEGASNSTSPDTQPGTQTNPANGQAARTDTASGDTASQTKNVADKKIVVLAQTGVTGNQIDELIIENTNALAGATTNGSMTIIQPGTANFLDQIQWARQYLGISTAQTLTNDFFLYLDINFLGYDSNIQDDIKIWDTNEYGGEPVQITDTITYKIVLRTLDVSLNNTGSRYDITFGFKDTIGFSDEIYRTKTMVRMQGSTITELLKSFEAAHNEDLRENANLFDKPDQIEFNLNALVGGQDVRTPSTTASTGATVEKLYIKNEEIPSPASDQNVELTTVPIFDGEIQEREVQQIENDGSSETGSTEKRLPGVLLTAREGSTIYTVVAQVLSMNKEFQSYVSRKQTLDDPGNDEVDDKQTFVAWFDVHCEIQTIGWDKKRNRYAKKYIYTPYLIEDAQSDIALTTKETSFLNESVELGLNGTLGNRPVVAIATKRLQDLYNAGALHKSYFYMFTGLNDQIINLDISYDMGQTLLLPPKGGVVGDYSVVNRAALTPSQPIVDDGRNDLNAAENTNNKESVVGLFNKIKGLADDIKTVADAIGRTPTELAGILSDATGRAARNLAESLDSATVNRLASSLGTSDSSDPADTPTTNTEISVTSSGPYSPEVSGFLYAADFVQPGGALTQDEIDAAGLLELPAPAITAGTPPATPTARYVPSPLSGITSDGPASVLMGYVYRARENTGFLQFIEMTIRGDPYYVVNKNSGKFEYGKTSPDQLSNPGNGKKNYFLLTIGTPRPYDLDVSDEDNNTGYWSEHSISGTFSGLYRPSIWKNRFSGGMFTTEITAAKEVTVPLQYIRRVLPGETPPDLNALTGNQNIENLLTSVNDQLQSNTGGAAGASGAGGELRTSNPSPPNATGFANPLGDAFTRVSSEFGNRIHPITKKQQFHNGIDLPAIAGTPIYAAKDGVVLDQGFDNRFGSGYFVRVDHGNGVITSYAHMEGPALVSSGDPVTPTTVLGGVGNTGRSTGPHLHYRVIVNGESVDPRPYISGGG